MDTYKIKDIQGEVLYSGEYDCFRNCIESAVNQGVSLEGADLRYADLRCANLRCANLWDSHLCGADLKGADLRGANLYDAKLEGADLRSVNLKSAGLTNADLWGADLRGADLRYADLEDADLRHSVGIKSYGPVGEYGRDIYAVKHEECIMFQIGCFWDTYEKALKAVEEKYGKVSTYCMVIQCLNATVSL